MQNIVIDEERINEYVKKMTSYLKEFMQEISIMKSYKKNLVWESNAGKMFKEQFDNKTSNYFVYAGKMIILITFLNELTGKFNEAVEEITNEFKKLNPEGEKDE
jgi:hypothetical protein